ncbi:MULTISPECIES: nucleotidyltransferase family protein [unclassified Duganella]|uniref:nucleotidyltransferase family protein n=1 Tax=unclassified Duganella TaxID=2636909 RepID=UPI000E3467A6|nr:MULTISPECIES: nucleotidyltransferase family protein [unclassified Duganella]RFP10608.1 nucleotidyltransferase family protein [Duganella sp. BJB475]RFP27363.1 nucleotidyltransferase family protein [Duganella sp. BJB476]
MKSSSLEQRLLDLVRTSAELMAALSAARSLALDSWCIGAGAVRTLVWDALHGHAFATPLADVDLVYFAPDAPPQRDAELEARLRQLMPGLEWEVTNQAHVHTWFMREFGREVAPLLSLEEGVATWPEYATCIGVALAADGTIRVIAPHGLEDLFGLRVRHNPARADAGTYRHRVVSKRFAQRWPLLAIESFQ